MDIWKKRDEEKARKDPEWVKKWRAHHNGRHTAKHQPNYLRAFPKEPRLRDLAKPRP